VLALVWATIVLAGPQPDPPKEKIPALLESKPLTAGPKDDEMRKLLIARYNAALAEVKIVAGKVLAGAVNFEQLVEPSKRLVRAGVEVQDKPANQITFLEQYVELTKEFEKTAETLSKNGRIPPNDLERTRYYRLDAEIQLLRAKRAVASPKDKKG
jgi:hypothetical protein